MESIAKQLHSLRQPLNPSLNPHRPFPSPVISLSFQIPPPSSSPIKLSTSTRASSSCRITPLNQTLTTIIKTTSIALSAAAVLFFTRFNSKPAIASPVAASSSTVDPTKESSKENVSFEEQDRALQDHLARNPSDVEALRSLMEVRIKSKKLLEAIEVVERLIELEPSEDEWSLLKSQIYTYSGDFESAKDGFEAILQKDPLRVEAYHGLIMASSESGGSLEIVLKRIEGAMNKCKKEKKNSDLRDFKLLIAQVRVMEEKYFDALKVYEELVKEEPKDFRPYLCQGIIYTLLRKKDEAQKMFEQFKKLVPKNHPYREYLVDNMFATNFFSEKLKLYLLTCSVLVLTVDAVPFPAKALKLQNHLVLFYLVEEGKITHFVCILSFISKTRYSYPVGNRSQALTLVLGGPNNSYVNHQKSVSHLTSVDYVHDHEVLKKVNANATIWPCCCSFPPLQKIPVMLLSTKIKLLFGLKRPFLEHKSWPEEELVDGMVPCAISLIVENSYKAYTQVVKRSTISANALQD
ncbi:hypothetical protein SADUNF_Sadunf06G0167700 [Salix dunnii]|uniref:Chloroplast lumen common family protein n=1 Tax=Salix dunnii TaxID=1413687 RepID=A0A835K7P0_9ROSI|nr:hypothetical protein SADUNF_Sadunf06G0167700 [Salix dunnii]